MQGPEYALAVQGVPVRIEIGPRDVQQQACVVGRRDRPGKEGKQFGVSIEPESFVRHIRVQLQEVQDILLQKVGLSLQRLSKLLICDGG